MICAEPPTRDQLTRGEKLSEVAKQPQYQPLPVEKQVALIYAATNGYLDAVPVERLRQYETELYGYLDARHPETMGMIVEKKILDDDGKKALNAALEDFGKQFAAAVAA